MKALWPLLLIAIFVAIAVLSLKKGREGKGTFAKRKIATANEQGMYWRLIECFPQPEYVVLTQVSFGAMLIAKDGASRYSFSQKRADFVVADKTFKVLAVVELDDSSHKGREADDAKRDAMLTQAGYKVLRYARIPDAGRLKTDITTPPEQQRSDRHSRDDQ